MEIKKPDIEFGVFIACNKHAKQISGHNREAIGEVIRSHNRVGAATLEETKHE